MSDYFQIPLAYMPIIRHLTAMASRLNQDAYTRVAYIYLKEPSEVAELWYICLDLGIVRTNSK